MGLIQTYVPELWKPDRAGIDWANPATDGLLFLTNAASRDVNDPGEPAVDQVSGAIATRNALTTDIPEVVNGETLRRGYRSLNTGVGNLALEWAPEDVPDLSVLAELTVVAFCIGVEGAANTSTYAVSKSDASTAGFAFQTRFGTGLRMFIANPTDGLVVTGDVFPAGGLSNLRCIIGRYDGVNMQLHTVNLQGNIVSSPPAAVPNGIGDSSSLNLSIGKASVGSNFANFDYFDTRIHGRAWTSGQVQSFLQDTTRWWQVYEPQRRLIPVGIPGVAPGGNPTISLHPASPIIDATEAEIAAGGKLAILGIADGLFKTDASLTTAERQQFIAGCQDISTAANRVEWEKVIAATQADADARVTVNVDQLSLLITFAPAPTYNIATDAEIRFIAPTALYTATP